MAKEKLVCTVCGEKRVIPGLFLCLACRGDGKDSVAYREWQGCQTGALVDAMVDVTPEEVSVRSLVQESHEQSPPPGTMAKDGEPVLSTISGTPKVEITAERTSFGSMVAEEPELTTPVLVAGEPCPACGKKVGRRTAKSGTKTVEEEE